MIEAEHTPRPEDPVEEDVFPETVGQLLVEMPGPIVTADPSCRRPTVCTVRQQMHATYKGPDLEIVLKDIRHRPFADPPPVRQVDGQGTNARNSSRCCSAR